MLPDPAALHGQDQPRDGPEALREVVSECYRLLGSAATAHLVDGIKSVGFRYATQGGMTIAVDDIKVPPAKPALLAAAERRRGGSTASISAAS